MSGWIIRGTVRRHIAGEGDVSGDTPYLLDPTETCSAGLVMIALVNVFSPAVVRVGAASPLKILSSC